MCGTDAQHCKQHAASVYRPGLSVLLAVHLLTNLRAAACTGSVGELPTVPSVKHTSSSIQYVGL